MGINRVVVSGNLTRDPEVRQTAAGLPVMSMGVAVNDRRKNPQTGQWEDFPNFVDCTLFGTRAQGLAQYLHKGSKVCIEGKLRWSQWERDGQKRSKLEVVVDEIELMEARQNAQNAPMQQQPAQQPQQQMQPAYGQMSQAVQQAQPVMYADENIPF